MKEREEPLMKSEDIGHVFIVGAGTMGQQIALQCAMHGCDVTLYDLSPDARQTARARNAICPPRTIFTTDTSTLLPSMFATATGRPAQYIDKGRLGVKSGRGFYTYPDPAYARPGFLTGEAIPPALQAFATTGDSSNGVEMSGHELKYPAGAADRNGLYRGAIGARSAVLGGLDVQA